MTNSTDEKKKSIIGWIGQKISESIPQPGKVKRAKTSSINGLHATNGANAGFSRPDKLRSAKTSSVAVENDSPSARELSGPSVAIKRLQDSISLIMGKNTVGFKATNYLPDNDCYELIKQKQVEEILPNASSDLVKFIVTKAIKVFAITLLVISDPKQLQIAMNAFLQHCFTDEDSLPVAKITDSGQCHLFDKSENSGLKCVPTCSSPEGNVCPHQWQASVFHHEFWDRNTFDTFYAKQWALLVQRFTGERFQCSLEDDRILPFAQLNPEHQNDTGKFGRLSRTIMLKDHQDLHDLKPVSDRWVEVAIKTFKPVDDKDYKISEAWKNEALAHMELNGRNHPHIIKGIAAFTQNKDYHLVLEWSDGDLRSFWAASPNPDLSGERIMEILKELRGLASALEEMHKVRPRPSRANSTASGRSNKSEQNRVLHNTETKDFMPIPTAGRAPGESQPSKGESRIDSVAAPPLPTIVVDEYDEPTVDLDQMENWRHGDIKPENILRFDIPSTAVEPGVVPFTWLGRLKLADLGRAKQRFQETQKMTTREYDEWRTKPYDSPDDWVGGQKTSMSRLYDIWSLGCVCFEMVIWLLYGFESHQNFSQKAIEELPTWRRVGTPYWAKKGNSAQVDKLVTLWINRILEVDPVAKRGVTALGDLLVLVQEKLLVVELPPAPKCRANAADMVKELDKIINNADTRPEYLYSNPDRTGIQAPPSRTSRQIDPAVQSGGNGSLSAHGAASVALTTRSMSRYTHNLSQQWRIFPDDEFAAKVLKLHEKELGELFQVKSASCTLCKSLDLDLEELEFTRSWQELQPKKKGNRCELCAVLLRGAKRSAPGEQFTPSRTFSFKRVPSGLQINGSAYPLLRICQKLDPGDDTLVYSPVGLPVLPEDGSLDHMNIIQAWRDECNKTHSCVGSNTQRFLPKRLLYVGKAENSLILVETKSMSSVEYLALSHPWGDETEDNPHFYTDTDNYKIFLKSVPEDKLPQTFLDAVKVTRALGVEYIWIDSLCIIQSGPDADFHDQAPYMQNIYSSASCVIAATGATDMASGFLEQTEHSAVSVLLHEGGADEERRLYVSTLINNFQQDVLGAHLNSRGWVFQERALGRRTIHFAENQTYWECGHGIRCETLGALTNSQAALMGDSDFPTYATTLKNQGAQRYLFTHLFEEYSRLAFSKDQDKHLAISGLEQRLTEAFNVPNGAGVFQKWQHRCLLWVRADGVDELTRIDFTNVRKGKDSSNSTAQIKPKMPPSWSWMAYVGGINYLNPPGGQMNWNHLLDMRLTGSPNTSWIYAKEDLQLKAEVQDFKVKPDVKLNETDLVYDDPKDDLRTSESRACEGKCIRIGSIDTSVYILVVRSKPGKAAYERIGAGNLPNEFIYPPDPTAGKSMIE